MSADVTAVTKENRIWWFVLALCSAATALLVLGYIDKAIWQTVILTLAAMWITGVALNVVAQGANTLMAGKADAAKTVAEGQKMVSMSQANMK